MRGALQQNSKMRAATVRTYQFSLPAVATCPGAGLCKAFCFAALEQARYPSARAYRERMLAWTKTEAFVPEMVAEVKRVQALRSNRGRALAVRVHASGDFYSPAYLQAWYAVAQACPDVSFYAYTKSVAFAKRLQGLRPANFTLILSLGGTMDQLVDVERDRHSRIFASVEALRAAGYVEAQEDDAAAWSGPNTRIGLVMFGARAKKGNKALGNV